MDKRVKHWNYETGEDEFGTIIKESKVYYTVIPDYNLQINVLWNKLDCELIKE